MMTLTDAMLAEIEADLHNRPLIVLEVDVTHLIAALRASRERAARLRGALVDAALRRCCDQVPPSATDGVGFMTLRDEAGHAVVHVDGCTARAALGEEATVSDLADLKAICETLIRVARPCQYDDCGGEGHGYLHVHIPEDHMADWGAMVKAVRDA